MQLLPRPSTLLLTLTDSLIFKRLPGILLGLLIGFGFVITAQAAEPEACLFGILECDEHGVVWEHTPTGNEQVAQLGSNDGLAEAIIAVGYFLSRQILPLLIFLAFFIFLYYLARTFIIDAAFTDKREESRQRAIWGFLAFILIVSLWGIVNLLVGGFRLDQEQSLCPDYLGSFCGNRSFYSGESNLNFGNPSSIDPQDTSVGGAVVGGSNADGTQPQPSSQSALGELLFGSFADNASFNFRSGAPRAAESAVQLTANTSCVAGITALQTSASIESLQSAYLFSRDLSGATSWHNLTDATSATGISYDADTIQPIVARLGSENVALVHTHPQATINQLGLAMTGYAPSVSDLSLMCDDVVNNGKFVLVDSTGVWTLESTGITCPRRATEVDALPVISTLLQLAIMAESERSNEFSALYNWDELPASVRQTLRDYVAVDFDDLSTTELILQADTLARAGSFSIRRQTPADFCASF